MVLAGDHRLPGSRDPLPRRCYEAPQVTPAQPAAGLMTRFVLHERRHVAPCDVSLGRGAGHPALPPHGPSKLCFPEDCPLGDVPTALWRTLAILCLHSHWTLLRPCGVELPWTLAPGEREFWLRLLDAAVVTLEATRGGTGM